jgi:haloacetate dehalogenase
MTKSRSAVEVDCNGIRISAEISGSGSPALLLHGYPETKAMWNLVAPRLAQRHTVIAADLRGYGDSDKPAGERYSKREMAADQLALMNTLGFERFAVVGHDRGARVGHRLAIDHPDVVSSLAVLDIVPTVHMFDNVDRTMATSYFHWFLLAMGDGTPEALLRSAPIAWLASRFRGRALRPDAITDEAYAEYERCFDDATIAASCADYRAAATVDLDQDRADREAGRMLGMPLLALWGDSSYVGRNFDVRGVWQTYASSVEGHSIRADHYLAEEAPEDTAKALLGFLDAVGAGR